MSRPILVKNLDRPLSAPATVEYCDTFKCRLRGLMFRSSLHPDKGLLLVEKRDARLDSAIHMFFVPFDLAVFWIDSTLTIVDKVIARAWRPAYVPKQPARFILELHPQRRDDYQIGNKVQFDQDA
jgi:uncharacterized membrane protein (UPF0127 family)